MKSRERVLKALNHENTDKVPLDIGAASTTGMHVSSVYMLRQYLQLDPPGKPVKVIEPHQMLGEIKNDLIDTLGIDIIGIWPQKNIFGFKNENWKPWNLFDGTPVLVPEKFNTIPDENGTIFMYPQGDLEASPCAQMIHGSYYFDILSKPKLKEDCLLDTKENLEEFNLISKEDLDYFKSKVDYFFNNTEKAILVNFGGTAFGNVALIPGSGLKNPKGIRNIEEWYTSLANRKSFIYELFEKQCEIAINNLSILAKELGNNISVLYMSGADYGMQNGPLISPKTYRSLFKPFQKKLNDFVHSKTKWKIFIHSCGSISKLLPDMIDAGFDIINPVQTSAADMDPKYLKTEYGDKVSFWGGGVDTQFILPFGTKDEVYQQVLRRLNIFSKGGGYIFNPIHNIQPKIPVANMISMFKAYTDYNSSIQCKNS